ncbi:hypothetical protein BLNAU_22694 [Blattamonas nauphoetae]|uniref:Uncharacterized protein n=1 Tax=Blattamonas nauphoetae TaxID=2049346 RepID=A0ABQ9WSB3_9EUKA|nr:hypothetical protein BLNAU_22694 [Blattamonas nauphoetae]
MKDTEKRGSTPLSGISPQYTTPKRNRDIHILVTPKFNVHINRALREADAEEVPVFRISSPPKVSHTISPLSDLLSLRASNPAVESESMERRTESVADGG